MAKRIVLLLVVLAVVGAALVATGVVEVPGFGGVRGPGDASPDAPGEAGVEDGATPGLAGAGMRPAMEDGKGREDGAAPVEDLVPAEVRGTAAAQAGGVVRGRVVRAEGKAPVGGTTVRLLRPDSLFAYLRAKREGRHDDLVARTDADGRFTFRDVLPSQGYALWVRPTTGASVTKVGLEVLAKRATDVGDLVLGPSGGLGGRVVDGVGKPIQGARVVVTWKVVNDFQVILADPSTLPWIEAEATTDADGVWAAKALEPGDKTLVWRAPSGASDVKSPVPCRDGEVRTDVDVVLGGTLAIAGRVVWDDATPLSGARVFAKSTKGPAAHTTDTGADGVFRLGPLAEGSYMIGAMVHGLPIQVGRTAKAGTDGLTLTFERGGSLAGTVLSKSTGKPLPRFRLTPVFTGELEFSDRFVSDRIQKVLGPTGFASSDGAFRFERLQAGPYTIVVECEGYPRFEAPGVQVVAGRETTAPPIEIPDGNRVAGVVVDAAGKPVADCRVFLSYDLRAEDVEPEQMGGVVSDIDADAVTDEKGAFETGLLTPAVYRLGAVAEGRMPGTVEKLDLRTGSRTGLEVKLPAGGGISARVLDASGRPAPNMRVVFVHEDGFVAADETDEKAVASLRPARVGRWVVVWESRAVWAALVPQAPPGAASPPPPPKGPAVYEAVRAAPGAEEVQVADGAIREVALRLPRLVRLVGRARLDGGPPKTTRAGLWQGGTWIQVTLDAEGRFTLENVEPGAWSFYMPVGEGEDRRWISRPCVLPDAAEHHVELDFSR